MARPIRLRRPTLVAAPIFVLAVMGATAALATALWGAWNPGGRDATFVVVLAVSSLVAGAAIVAGRGCFVEVDPVARTLRDVVGWVTVRRIEQDRIAAVRVRAGLWRWFVLEMDDELAVVLAGISPVQFPARLLPGAFERDLADLAVLRGDGEPAVERRP